MERVLVETKIYIGGDLPESMLPSFLIYVERLFDTDDLSQRPSKKEHIKNFLLNKIECLQNSPLDLEILLENGEVDTDFIIYSFSRNLNVKVETAPYIDSSGRYYNHAVWMPKYIQSHNPSVIPLDSEDHPTVLVDDVFKEIDKIFDEYERPMEQAPILVQEPGIPGEIAKRKLCQEPLRKILTEVLRSRIDYPDMTIQPFNIIKGA